MYVAKQYNKVIFSDSNTAFHFSLATDVGETLSKSRAVVALSTRPKTVPILVRRNVNCH